MTLKTITHPITGKTFKMGRKRGPARHPMLKFGNYLYKSLPAPPLSVDYTHHTPDLTTFLHDVLGNDTLGDCTCAGIFHIGGTLMANALSLNLPVGLTAADAVGLYERACGYVPGQPNTDQGGDEQAVLAYVRQHGLLPDGSHKIAAWASVDATNVDEVKTAINLFENVYFGVELPDAWVNPMPNGDGFTWNVAGDPDPENGHCFVGLGYDAQGVLIDTWGMIGHISWPAVAKYASNKGPGELYTVFSDDMLSAVTHLGPNGFDASQLQADIQAIS